MIRPVEVTWRIRGPNGEDLRKTTSETEVDDKVVNTLEKMMEFLFSEIKEAYELKDVSNVGIVDWKFSDTEDKKFNTYEDASDLEQPAPSASLTQEELNALETGMENIAEEEKQPTAGMTTIESFISMADKVDKPLTALQAFNLGTAAVALVSYNDKTKSAAEWKKMVMDQVDRLAELRS